MKYFEISYLDVCLSVKTTPLIHSEAPIKIMESTPSSDCSYDSRGFLARILSDFQHFFQTMVPVLPILDIVHAF